MNLTEIASNTLFYRAPDGRIVFRPWGARGPCYLLTETQRITRARIQLAYYALIRHLNCDATPEANVPWRLSV